MILSDLCVRRPVFATMLIGSLVVAGWFSYQSLGLDLMPKAEMPVVTVTPTLPGAGPEEMETQVTKPIEEVINTISGIDELRSVTREGLSQVIVMFELEKDLEAAAQDVRDKVGSVLAKLPEDADPPIVEKFDVEHQHTFRAPWISLVGKPFGDPQTTLFANHHQLKAFGPAGDHVLERERSWGASLYRAVEHFSVCGPAGVMNFHAVFCRRLVRSVPRCEHFGRKTARRSFRVSGWCGDVGWCG
jgi:hypothetical protein